MVGFTSFAVEPLSGFSGTSRSADSAMLCVLPAHIDDTNEAAVDANSICSTNYGYKSNQKFAEFNRLASEFEALRNLGKIVQAPPKNWNIQAQMKIWTSGLSERERRVLQAYVNPGSQQRQIESLNTQIEALNRACPSAVQTHETSP